MLKICTKVERTQEMSTGDTVRNCVTFIMLFSPVALKLELYRRCEAVTFDNKNVF